MDTRKQELKDRVEAKVKRVQARILELRADSAGKSREQATRLEEELTTVRSQVSEGYENLKDQTVEKLNQWLKD
ncbi:MAG: hypothetical protein LAT64_12130 [Phycisphaerales bacterium]|nr:hypothetical protein [Planctomycetota bacterium]MCH8509501.1 hypothetical protein [Phycisphaerales bacterium]